MNIVHYILLFLLIPLLIAVCYLYFLALVGITQRKKYPEVSNKYDFLILLPAHNEEKVISKTLESILNLIPLGKVTIAVIADNCDDNTVEIAKSFDIKVLERYNDTNKGKGYALHWGISQFNLQDYDYVAIIDADTITEPNMLIAMAESFEAGAGAVQLYYGFIASQKTHLSYLQEMASFSENLLFYKARSILKLPILLRGSGMAIKTDVLQKYPWNSFSITEDVDYAVNLLKEGVIIDCNVNSAVYSAATSSYKQSTSQKIRWASGTAKLIKEKVFGLIYLGLIKRKLELIELGFSFFLLSRPLLIYLISIVLILNNFFSPSFQDIFSLLCLSLISLLIIYNILGIIYMKDKFAAFRALFFIPFYGIWFLYIQIVAIIKSGKLSWVRTERNNHE